MEYRVERVKNLENKISVQASRRMPFYLKYLDSYNDDEYISASKIAEDHDLNEIQVRKDLALISKARGIPNKGFKVRDLKDGIKEFLGYHNSKDAILIGVGNLGKALLSYGGFKEYGLNIVAAFDNNKKIIGKEINSKKIFSMAELKKMTKKLKVHLAIVTVPDDAAQDVANQLCDCDVLAIWNFTSVHIKVNKDIFVKEENLASSLSELSSYLTEKA